MIEIQSHISLLGECDKRGKVADSPPPHTEAGRLVTIHLQDASRAMQSKKKKTKKENSTPGASHRFCIARALGDEMARARGHLEQQPSPRREMKPKHPLINTSRRGRHLITNFPRRLTRGTQIQRSPVGFRSY